VGRNEIDGGSGSDPTGHIVALPLITGTTTDFRAKAKVVHPTNSTYKAVDDASNLTISPSSFSSNPSFLIGELLLGNLSETVVVQGNAPHDRPGLLVGHLIGNRASFLCTEAPMVRVPDELAGWHHIN
jgi:hypothetical protein